MHSWQPAAIPEAELLLPPSPRSPTSPAKGCDLVGHGIPQQKLTAYMLDVIRAAEAGILLPARECMEHIEALLQGITDNYMNGFLLEPCAVIKDGRFSLKPAGKIQQRLGAANEMVGSAATLELARLIERYGRPLAERMATASAQILQTAVATHDALLARQTVQPSRKQLSQQDMAATLTQLSILGRSLAFRENLAHAVAAAGLRLSPENA